MDASFEVSIGLTTPNGIWFGIRLKREMHALVADRNVDVALEGDKTRGGSLTQNKGSSDCSA
jgi:hypothetical protein